MRKDVSPFDFIIRCLPNPHKKCNLITQDSYQNYIIMVCDNNSVGLDGVTSSKVVRK